MDCPEVASDASRDCSVGTIELGECATHLRIPGNRLLAWGMRNAGCDATTPRLAQLVRFEHELDMPLDLLPFVCQPA